MPPVLHIAFGKLARRAAQKVLAYKRRLGMNQRHHLLQLIAEPERPARLVERVTPPQSARQDLVHQPPVGQDIEGSVGRFYLYCAEHLRPVLSNRFESAVRGSAAPALHEISDLRDAAAGGEAEDDLPRLPSGQSEWHVDGGARILRRAQGAGEARPRHRSWIAQRAISPQEFSTIATKATVGNLVDIEECDAAAEIGVIRVA